jgi:tetratricopeptide (TPR) repeat protein
MSRVLIHHKTAVAARALIALCLAGALQIRAQQLDLDQIFEDRNLEPLRRMLREGEYDLCRRVGELAGQRGLKSIDWRLIQLEAMRAMGAHREALDLTPAMLEVFPGDLTLLMERHDLATALGEKEIARQALAAVNEAARAKPASSRSAADWVALGRAALATGADAQKVISQYFQAAQKKDAALEAAYLAEGWLAMEKNDPARAADVFRAGIKNHGETPALRHGLAAAFMGSDRAAATENIARALEVNARHAGALLLRADLLIGAEKFLEAEAAIQAVLDVDEGHPEAWAMRAAIAAITSGDAAAFESARRNALERWPENPRVDHTLGRLVSRAYRFAEGAAAQRRALEFDADFLPAKVQLCLDLLRLGEEAEAWEIAAAVRAADGYNVQAVNLGRLERQIAGFTEQRSDHFTFKMPLREWEVYGGRARALLEEARDELCARYGVELRRPVLVEFFPSQQDFAVRTFGNLGGQGILGACFGAVVTMNSPGSLGHGRSNWEATLWHEFCHVVTLTATRNRMPRWLSEGISVYEEGRRDPAWGMRMTGDFRARVLDGGATPIGQLSQAFLGAADSDALMFAYFQSGRVVQWLVETHGIEKLLAVMAALAEGLRINEAIEREIAPLDELETAFTAVLQAEAEAFGRDADWSEPEFGQLDPGDLASIDEWLKENPASLEGWRARLQFHLKARDWENALAAANRLAELTPEDFSGEGPYLAKARVLRELGRETEERAVLERLCAARGDALPALLRLMELATAAGDWPAVAAIAARVCAINPFLRTANEALAAAATRAGDDAAAITAWRRLLALQPPATAPIHLALARLLRSADAEQARRHLLDALAEAPRFLEAHQLYRDWERAAAPEDK